MSQKNYYVVVSPKCNSVLHSATPGSAAAKAYSHCSKGKPGSMRVSIKKRGSDKVMHYKVDKIPERRVVIRDGQEIVYNYKTKVTSLNKKIRNSKRK